MDTMAKMQNSSIDYIITSPPYNVKTERIAKYKDFKDGYSQEQYFEQQKQVECKFVNRYLTF